MYLFIEVYFAVIIFIFYKYSEKDVYGPTKVKAIKKGKDKYYGDPPSETYDGFKGDYDRESEDYGHKPVNKNKYAS
jgi:hypothetical protein